MNEGQIYHRKQGRQPDDVATARAQIASQEMWGGPPRNYMGSDIPKVKAYWNHLPLLNDRQTQESGLEFRTLVKVDSYHPHFAYWSIDPNDPTTEREGLWNEDGYGDTTTRQASTL